MDEVQGPVCEPKYSYSCVTITKVENGYLIEARDRLYTNQRYLIANELDAALETTRNLIN